MISFQLFLLDLTTGRTYEGNVSNCINIWM